MNKFFPGTPQIFFIMESVSNSINTSTWACSHCSKRNAYNNFCECSRSFYCIKCSRESNVRYDDGENVICSNCNECSPTIIGYPPKKWDYEEIDGEKFLKATFETTTRSIEISVNLTDFNLEDYSGEIPYIRNVGRNNLSKKEKDYIHSMIFGFYPNKPEKCGCVICYNIVNERYTKLKNIFEENNLDLCDTHTSILKIYKIQFVDFSNPFNGLVGQDIENIISLARSYIDLLGGMQENEPIISSQETIKEITDGSCEYSSVECNEGREKDDCCSICMDEYEDTSKVSKMKCCSNIIHTECLTNWLSKYNNTCPLCRTEHT